MASPTNGRFPDSVDQALAEYTRRSRSKESTVVVGAVREWLRMQAHRGVVFVTTLGGECRAGLVAGPPVWSVAESWLQHDADERTAVVVGEVLGLSVRDVETTMAYWAEHRDEIDDVIPRHHGDQDAALAA